MAESELAVLTRQCLSRRILDKHTLNKEVAAWERTTPKPTGNSQLATPASNSKRCTLNSNDSGD
jgi:hypothetical protein